MSVSSNDIEYNNQLLNEAKKTYTDQFILYLKASIFDGFHQMFENSLDECNDPKHRFKKFQENLKKIKLWNQEIIKKESERIIKNSKCGWLDDLLVAIFTTNAKILLSIRKNRYDNKKVKIEIPRFEDFVHKLYINIARIFYGKPLLFEDGLDYTKTEKNNKLIKQYIVETIEETISLNLPIENVIRDNLIVEDNNVEDLREKRLTEFVYNTKNEFNIPEETNELIDSTSDIIEQQEVEVDIQNDEQEEGERHDEVEKQNDEIEQENDDVKEQEDEFDNEVKKQEDDFQEENEIEKQENEFNNQEVENQEDESEQHEEIIFEKQEENEVEKQEDEQPEVEKHDDEFDDQDVEHLEVKQPEDNEVENNFDNEEKRKENVEQQYQDIEYRDVVEHHENEEKNELEEDKLIKVDFSSAQSIVNRLEDTDRIMDDALDISTDGEKSFVIVGEMDENETIPTDENVVDESVDVPVVENVPVDRSNENVSVIDDVKEIVIDEDEEKTHIKTLSDDSGTDTNTNGSITDYYSSDTDNYEDLDFSESNSDNSEDENEYQTMVFKKNIPRDKKSVDKIENDIGMLRRRIKELEQEGSNVDTKDIKIDNVNFNNAKTKFTLGSHKMVSGKKNNKIKLVLDDESDGDL